ncbi:MAG TPA: ABC transporter permease [Terriglobales bacterium]|nr:ABC transporter permease [Terriglobales bacterium]
MALEQWLYKLPLRLRSLFRRRQVEGELNEEFQYHLARQIDVLIAQGLSPTQARETAMRAMGGMEQQQEKCREARGMSWIEDLVQDVRYALRTFRKSPALASVIVASLALGIGANTAIFSVIDAVMLKMLPVRDPQQLVLLKWSAPRYPQEFVSDIEGSGGHDRGGLFFSQSFSSDVYKAIKQQNQVFDSTLAFAGNDEDVNIEVNGQAESARHQAVSGDFFNGLGVRPFLGRTLLPSDDTDSAPPAIMVSYAFWQKHFGSSRDLHGQTLAMNGESVTIVGVAPAEFFGIRPGDDMDLYIPLSLYLRQWNRLSPQESLLASKTWWLGIIGRLKPGISLEQAQTQLQVILNRALDVNAKNPKDLVVPRLDLLPASKGLNALRKKFSTSLFLLMGMVGLVLFIACANVAGLLMARASGRRKEIAVRLGLGASRSRIIRQLLAESVLLGIIGGFAGLLVSLWASSALVRLLSTGRSPIDLSVHPDFRVLGFTAATSILSGIVFGLIPALTATRVSVVPALKESGTQTLAAAGRFRLGKSLVAGQVALSLLLLVAAGLLLRSLEHLQRANLGFDQHALLNFEVRPGLNGYKNDALANYYEELQRRVQSLSGVRNVAFAQMGPIAQGESSGSVTIPGYTAAGQQVDVYRQIVGPNYFQTMDIPIVLGRPTTQEDGPTTPKTIVVNETLVRTDFHGDNPIGKSLVRGSKDHQQSFEIVGVAKDVKYGSIRGDVPPTIYLPYRQWIFLPSQMRFFVRTDGDASAIAASIQRLCLALDKNVPVVDMQTEEDVISQSLLLERTFALLSSAFAALALLLACVGLYGTFAYTVSQRTSEIGVRMALGAKRESILSMILRETLLLVIIGIVVGLPIAWAATRFLKAQLFGLSAHDPLTIASSGLAILAITLLAGYLPARRASRVNPMVALRCE